MVLSRNPLFPANDDNKPGDDNKPSGYLMAGHRGRIEPLHEVRYGEDSPTPSTSEPANPAVKLIRAKLDRLYDNVEPNAVQEEKEAQSVPLHSPHQQFMYDLSTSGKSLAEIQTEWHNYYVNLPDEQKHQVWQEFYDSNNPANRYTPTTPAAQPQVIGQTAPAEQPAKPENGIVVADYSADYQPGQEDAPSQPNEPPKPDAASKAKTGRAAKAKTKLSKAKQKAKTKAAQNEIQQKVRAKVKSRAAKVTPKTRQNLSSLAFGLATGLVVLLIFMFSFFNQIIITPFIRPAAASAAPIIVDQNSLAADDTTKVIIPKINVDIPVIYDIGTTNEAVIQNNLEDGVIHYPTTEVPGQKGNAAFFGHSSNNIFNPGKYKFAFVLLHTLKIGDIFYLTYNHKVYGYKVIDRKIVEPTDTYVLDDVPGQTATATLITCDPPGTSLHRLVVVGQQISPNPAGNSQSTTKDQPTQQPTQITDNGPSLWSRIWNSVF